MYTEKNNELIRSMGNASIEEDQAALWDKLNPKHPQEKKAGDMDVPDSRRS